MKRKTRIIQISGIKGLLFAGFVVTCLAAGFIAFPAIVAMYIWNYAAGMFAFPAINIYQGLLLWAMIAITGYIINDRKKYLVALKAPAQLSEQEVQKILERVKLQSQAQALNSMLLKSTDNKPVENTKNSEEKSEKEKENV